MAKQEVYRKPGMRLKADMSPLMHRYFHASTPGKGWKGCHLFDKAHTVMLAERGIIPRPAGVAILRALRGMEAEGAREVRERLGNHVHCGEAFVSETEGPDISGWIHCGRSSGDLSAVSVRVDARDGALQVMGMLLDLRRQFVDTAQRHVDTVMPGYTQLQHAEPMTLGFYLMSCVHQFERDFARCEAAFRRINVSPAGCAILTGTNFPIDRERTRQLMGFDGLFQNARDAIWSTDHITELLGAYMAIAAALGRLADDLTIWHSSEFKMIDLPDAYCGTSSIMPQKKNPYGTQTVRGLCGEVIGHAMAYMSQTTHQSDSCEMLTMAPSAMYGAEEKCLVMIEIMRDLVGGMEVDAGLMRKRAGMFWSQAASLANEIVLARGIPFRHAHQIVAILVRRAIEAGAAPGDVDSRFLDEAATEFNGQPLRLDDAAIRKAMDPASIVQSKALAGGTAASVVRDDIRAARDRIAADQSVLDGMLLRLREADDLLESAIDRVLSGEAGAAEAG